MADEKTARGKPLPKEEVDFVLIGAGGIVVIVSWRRVGVNFIGVPFRGLS